MIIVKNGETICRVKQLAELILAKGRLICRQQDMMWKEMENSHYEYSALQLRLSSYLSPNTHRVDISREKPYLYIEITYCRQGDHVVKINDEKALEVVLLEYQFLL